MSRWVEVILNVPLQQSFTYKVSDDLKGLKDIENLVGYRAIAQFGARKMTCFIIRDFTKLPKDFDFPKEKIKPLTRIIDKEAVFTEEHVELALWMEHFYLCARGEALSTMIPSGKREVSSRIEGFSEENIESTPRELSSEQEKAVLDIIDEKNKRQEIHYLYGPTGTGKTEVFLQAAEHILKKGKGVIYLVPEIGLTQQVVEAVVSRFGNTAAVLHSGLSASKKLFEWRRILKKEARVVIGARSAVFAPLPDLGMIIIDEEHDGSYKSGQNPRYSARQVAMRRCAKHVIPLIMGSATPSVESWHLMQTNSIKKHTLSKRLAGGKEPSIEIVNLCNSTSGAISEKLEIEMRKTYAEGRQSILFLNRRGFTHFYRCNSCGYELKCKNCSVAMTYHKNENKLRCHYCGWTVEPPKQCPECGSLDSRYCGFGTEFIESEVRSKFPNAKIKRVDTDSLTKASDLQETINEFRRGAIDILLGTQIVAKGLNFPSLQLVGVILADTGLHMPDFRAAERTFSLITQVAGRAGRFFPDGKVIVQTYSPKNPAIALACNNDTINFYRKELEQRKLLCFPPFSRLIRLVFRSADSKAANLAADGAYKILESYIEKQHFNKDVFLLGPSECPLAKIAANYRCQILLRGPRILFLQQCTAHLVLGFKKPSSIYIEVDVDPVSLI